MVELATSGLTPEQLALVMELSASLAAEAQPARSKAAERQARYVKRHKASQMTENDAPDANVNLPHEEISIPPQSPSVVSDETTSPELKPEHVVEAWNAKAPRLGLKEVRKFTPQRQRKLATRIRQSTIQDFTEAIDAIERSPFLRGENDRGWRANFDWMLEPKNFTKLIEGTYDR